MLPQNISRGQVPCPFPPDRSDLVSRCLRRKVTWTTHESSEETGTNYLNDPHSKSFQFPSACIDGLRGTKTEIHTGNTIHGLEGSPKVWYAVTASGRVPPYSLNGP